VRADGTGNRLLDRLASERDVLVTVAQPASLVQRQVLWEPAEEIGQVYFPLSGVISLLAVTRDGASVEVATIGTEGMAGLPVFLGRRNRAAGRAMCQIPGHGLLVDADRFEAVVADNPGVEGLLRRYTHAFLIHVTQGVVCNRLHSVDRRLARWILEMDDRIHPDELPVTHEFLAQMLGVRRASVTEAVAPLQAAGAIAHERGKIRVLDHDGLVGLACECYGVVREAYEELLDWVGPEGPVPAPSR
jgi:CRP-like cAMP-binding protein